ncbi:stage II sporulation protein R [Neobacillus niacini]|uniref:stage II sporulation protein R n=1 Tax=Neobacillus niacini TaxID=86668 RepID=UPI0005ED8B03|nr:stage II sporulation protein R [Neobacillus niacini]
MNSKVIVWSYLIILSLGTILNLYIPKTEAVAKDSIVIPAEAIRLRILANSDSAKDQEIKRMVRDAVNEQITLWVQELTSLEKAKTVITSKLPEVQAIAEKVVAEQGSTQSVNVEFGKVQFPTKLYGEFLYPAGEYQAILITLGEGTGANWWCVLYPPLCFLDFSNGVAVQSDGFEDKAYAAEEEKQVETPAVEEELESDPMEEKVTSSKKKSVDSKKEQVEVEEKAEVKVEDEKQIEVAKVSEKQTDSKKEVEKASEKQTDRKKEVEKASEKEKQTEVKKEVEKEKDPKKESEKEKAAPVYTSEDEEPVKVKFFVVEMFDSIFR